MSDRTVAPRPPKTRNENKPDSLTVRQNEGNERKNMKELLFCTAITAAVCCHGGLFDSTLKTVNKAAEVVNAVDDVRKSPVEAPQVNAPQAHIAQPQQDTASVGATDMPWDAAGYQARVAKVNDAMQKVAPKLPLSGEKNDWYNAAYGLTTTERQYNFLPPAQRVARISEDNRVKIDKFINWVDGGMQADSAPATPVAAAPRATAGASSAAPRATADASLAAPSSGATAKPFDDNTAIALRVEWQQKIQAALQAKEISLEASKQLNQEVCTASAQVTSEAAAKQFAADMQTKLDAEKTAQANRIAAEKKAAEEQRIAAEKEADEMRKAREKAAEEKRIAREEQRKADESRKKAEENEWRQAQAKQEAASAIQGKVRELRNKLDHALRMLYREDAFASEEEMTKVMSDIEAHKATESMSDYVKRMQDAVELYGGKLAKIEEARDLKNKLNAVLLKLWRDENVIASHEETEKIQKDIEAHKTTDSQDEYLKRLHAAVDQYEGQLTKLKEVREALVKKTAAALKYVEEKCSRDEWIRGEGLLTQEHKAELLKLLDGVSQQELAKCVREREDEMLFVAAQLISDQKVLEDLLVTNTQWVKGGSRNGMMASDFRVAYYNLYRNITDQELLMKLWNQKEISFSTDGDSYGYKDTIVLKLLDEAHIKTLNRQRIARRRAVQGKTIDVLGFYIGMPRQDYELLRFVRGLTDDDLMGNFGTFKIGQANRFRMSKKFTANILNMKDAISDLSAFTSKFVPGGEDAAGKIQAYGDVRRTYDIANETVDAQVDAYWWRSCPKLAYPCKVKLYEGGTLVIEADDTDVKFDFGAADAMMDEEFDETKLDHSAAASSGCGVLIAVFVAVVLAALYFFRKKFAGFIAAIRNMKRGGR